MHVEPIREYLRQGEGAPPPVFVGHWNILDDILATARDSAGQPKMTRIVQGAPGAGKTSLLHEMQKRWTGTDGTPRVVVVSSEAVTQNTSGVIQAIMAAGLSDPNGWLKIVRERFRRLTSVGASVAGYGLSAEFDVYREAKLISMAVRQGRARAWKHPVILAVDEAQALKGDYDSIPACFLREIHNGGTGLPLGLVLAGLSDTEAKADAMQLTRGRKIHEVKPLTEAQARDFMRRLALWFGLDTSRHNSRLEALADICDGWPRHLRHAGEILAEEVLRVNGDMTRMDWPAMTSGTWERRQAYYDSQRNSRMRHAKALVAAVMRDIPAHGDGTRRVEDTEVLASILRHRRYGDAPESVSWSLPKGMDAEDFLEHLVHRGALYISDEGNVHSPIPSFRTWLIEAGTMPEPSPDRRTGDDGPGCGF